MPRSGGRARSPTRSTAPTTRPGVTTSTGDWARRLNNIGYAAWLAGDSSTARRLLSQAIEVSETRFERAEHNLARVEGRE